MDKIYVFEILLSILIAALPLSGCKSIENNSSIRNIEIESSRNIIPCYDFINSIDSIQIIDKENNNFFSTIEDICIGDSSLFLLDSKSNLLKIDLSTGEIIRKINLKGHSNAECISPKAIANSKENIFILDMYGLKILTLNDNLDYVESTKTPIASMDFSVTPNGFLLFNLSCGEDDDLVILIDKKGEVKDKFISNNGIPDLILNQKIFSESSDGIVIVPPLQNKIYKYDNKSDNISCQYSHTLNSLNTGGIKTENRIILPNATTAAFESDRYVITNYFSDQIMGTNVFDKKGKKAISGLIKTDTPYPFSPLVLKDNTLYGVYESHQAAEDKIGHIIIKYDLKR